MLEMLEDRTTPSSISGLSPNSGPLGGGGAVNIYGGGFTGATLVTLGGVSAQNFIVDSATEITAEIPAHAAGVVNVVVTAPSGVSPITSADQYTYNAPAGPAVTGVSPNSGSTAGGVGVYIYGSGFSGATAVSFGGSSASFSVMSGTEIEAEAPAHAAGVVDVVVTGPGGSSSTSSADQYDYLAPPAPTVTGVSPNSGLTTGGGSYVTISGSGFYGPNGASDVTGVSFGGTASGMVDVMSGGVIEAYAPAHTAGTVDVTVTTANGTSSSSSADQFTYVPIATTTTLTSSANPSTLGQAVTLTVEVDGASGGVPTGTITFMSGTTTLGTGTLSPGGNGSQATLTLSTLAAGNYAIQAFYSGAAAFAASASAALPLTVLQATNTSLSVAGGTTSASGQAVQFVANVGTTAATWATGTVTFMEGTTVLGTATLSVTSQNFSQATLITSFQTLGAHGVKAIYSGDAANAGSTSAPITLIVRTPVTQYWTDATGDGLASTTGNWSGGPFVAGDSLVVDGVYAANSNTDINFNIAPTDALGGPLLAGMQIRSNYTGSVTFTASPAFTGTFDDNSGGLVWFNALKTVTAQSVNLLNTEVYGVGNGGIVTSGVGGMVFIDGSSIVATTVTAGAHTSLVLDSSTFDQGAELINYGNDAVWLEGDIAVNHGSIIFNAGDFKISGGQGQMTTVGGGTFVNGGTLEKTAMDPSLPPTGLAPITTLSVDFDNAPQSLPGFPANASVTVEAGILSLRGSGFDAAPFTIDAGAKLGFRAGIQTLESGTNFTGGGTFYINGGTALDDSGATISIATGTFNLDDLGPGGPWGRLDGTPNPALPGVPAIGMFTIANTTTALFADSALLNNVTVDVAGPLTIGVFAGGGTFTMTNSDLFLDEATTWTGAEGISMTDSAIVNDGTFTVANARQIMDASPPNVATGVLQPTSAFFNDGSFTKSAGTAATTISVPFSNAGSFSFNGTQINFDSIVMQTAAGAVTDLGGGTMTLTGGNLLPGTPNPTTFLLDAGKLTGTAGATINGSLLNEGSVDFGSALGTLTVTGGYTQTAGATLTINIGGSGAIDALHVSGQASLGGHLVVNGVQGTAAYDIFQAAGGFVNAFADVTAPWAPVYLTDDVWIQ